MNTLSINAFKNSQPPYQQRPLYDKFIAKQRADNMLLLVTQATLC